MLKHIDESLIELAKLQLTAYVNTITRPDPKAGPGMYACPLCPSGHGSRSSSTGAFHISSDEITWYCHSCNKSGSIFELVAEHENIPDFPGQYNFIASNFNISAAGQQEDPERPTPQETEKEPGPGTHAEYITTCQAAAGERQAQEYFSARGISAADVKRFGLGYDSKKKQIVIPYDRSGRYYIARSIENKRFYKPKLDRDAGEREPVYNKQALYNSDYCFITESAIDAISIMIAGGNAAAVNGTGIESLTRAAKEKPITATLIIAFDNDAGQQGQDAAQRAIEKLQGLDIKFKCRIARFSLDKYGRSVKDTNDMLLANRQQLERDIKAMTETEALKDSVKLYANNAFWNDIDAFVKTGANTGFPEWDKRTTGLHAGLYVVSAVPGMGKTTLCHQIADNLAAAGHNVIYFSSEQSRLALFSKSIARLTKMTETQVMCGENKDRISKAAVEYIKSVDDRLSVIAGNFRLTVSNIAEYVKDYINKTGIKPIVIVDYLQEIKPENVSKGAGIRENVNNVMERLAQLKNDYGLIMIVISSVNRSSYRVPLTMESQKESGEIDFYCDEAWSLELQCMEDDLFLSDRDIGKKAAEMEKSKSTIERKVKLKVLKSRYSGVGTTVKFDYHTNYAMFEESGNSTRSAEFWKNKGYVR